MFQRSTTSTAAAAAGQQLARHSSSSSSSSSSHGGSSSPCDAQSLYTPTGYYVSFTRNPFGDPEDCHDVEIASVALPIVTTDFPALKDRLPSPAGGWGFANSFQHAGYTLDVKTGVLELIITHRLIPGVTADAVYWLYRNLHKAVLYKPLGAAAASPVQLFQLLHPVDHLSFASSTPLVAKGSSLDWIELQMTNCRQGPFWNCSNAATGNDTRRGFVRGDNATLARNFLPTKVTSSVTQLDIKGYKAIGSAQGFTISYVAHDFSNATSAQGVHLGLNAKTTIRVGLVKAGANGEYVYDSNPQLAGLVNGGVKKFLLDNTNVKNIRRIGTGMLLHSIQEWQNLRNWLQPVWAANKGAMPADV
ncbi:hypothetical protein OEZ85_012426 [Tetradesmus obliquus]|uniref:Uncharacterized protein n=1 Tax=Tetradesmus obliquus TaxID=3088 RepID=A0ABY8TU18_TETOB|nr:hypothetical protein OEZ85_012426 [Tetradesmus obliquus]